MYRNTTDGSSDNEAVKIANAFKPFFKKWFEEWGRNCVRSKKMTVTTAPSAFTGLIGVTDAFSDTECMIPYKGDVALAKVGDTVWVRWMYDNQQTMYAELMGGIFKEGYSTDSTPYSFRRSGGGTLGTVNRETDSLIGGTVAWNQLGTIPSSDKSKTQNGVTITDNRDGSFTVSTDANGATANTYLVTSTFHAIKDRKYFFKSAPSGGSISTFYAYIIAGGIIESKTDLGGGCVQKCLADGVVSVVGLYVKSGTVITTPIKFIPQIFDLTQMFGSTIADYVYTLESGTAGAGIAWLKSYGFFTAPYYAYDAGSLQSVKTSAHKIVGFNQCGSTLTFGNIDSSGADSGTDTRYVRTASYTRVVPNTRYCFYASTSQQFMQMYCIEYDANKNFIARTSVLGGSTLYTTRYATFALNANTHYIRLFIYKSTSFSSVDGINICINLSKTTGSPKNGDYVPYVANEYALDSDLQLRGIPKLDANNNLYYDGDTYAADGTVTRKYGIVDLGEIAWSGNASSNGRFTGTLSTNTFAPYKWASNTLMICGAYVFDGKGNAGAGYFGANGTFRYYYSTSGSQAREIYVLDESKSSMTPADFKTAMSGVYLVYELATPTTETADPYINPQVVDSDGTEQYVDAAYTAGTRDFEMPVGHNTAYYELKSYEQQFYDTPKTDGTYRLVCKVVNGNASLEWIRDDVTVVQNPITNELFIY